MTSTEPSWPFVVNLSNSIIGVSMLALPFCMEQCGILLGCMLVLGTAYLTRLSCFLLLRSSQYGRRKSYETLAVHTFGPVGKLLVELSMIGLLLGTCTAFFVIIGDLAPAIVAKIFKVQETPMLRAMLLIVVAIAIVLPLSLKNNINALTNYSTASLIFYGVFVVLIFYFSMPTLFAGEWSGQIVIWRPSGTFAVLPILSLAFSCQAQVFVLYDCLQDPSVKKMTTIVNSAVNLVTIIYIVVGIFGYITYYTGVSGDVMNNFAPGILTQTLKLAFALSVVIGYPMMVFPCRLSINSLFSPEASGENIPGGALMIPPLRFRAITLSIVGGTLTVAVLIPNVEFILQLSGCVMGSLICYVFPGLMFLRLCSATDPDKWKGLFVACIGSVMLLVCTMTVVTTVPGSHNHPKAFRPELRRPSAEPPIGDASQSRSKEGGDGGGGKLPLLQPPDDVAQAGRVNLSAFKCPPEMNTEECEVLRAKKSREQSNFGGDQQQALPPANKDNVNLEQPQHNGEETLDKGGGKNADGGVQPPLADPGSKEGGKMDANDAPVPPLPKADDADAAGAGAAVDNPDGRGASITAAQAARDHVDAAEAGDAAAAAGAGAEVDLGGDGGDDSDPQNRHRLRTLQALAVTPVDTPPLSTTQQAKLRHSLGDGVRAAGGGEGSHRAAGQDDNRLNVDSARQLDTGRHVGKSVHQDSKRGIDTVHHRDGGNGGEVVPRQQQQQQQ
eukprot:scpid70359/ scgid25688/ Putative sodium-coupled neutral amino acid transporter 10